MQSFTLSVNCTKGSSASPTSTGIASFTFSAKLGLEHRGSRLPILFTSPRVVLINSVRTDTKNAVLTPAVSQIHSHRQTISIGANCVSPAIFFCARRHRPRIQFSRQLPQDFREYFFRISLHRTSRFRPLQAWFIPLQRLAMLLQGRSPFSCDSTLSALITASLTPSVIGDRPSHAIC